MEYRSFDAVEVRSGDSGTLTGLVTPFDRETIIGDLKNGGWRETVARGAFTKTLAEGDPLLVYSHDMTKPLARKSAGNLDLHEGQRNGQKGLVMKADPVDTTYARDLRALIDANVITGMSFGFRVVKDEWTDDDGEPSDPWHGTNRILREVSLVEVSPVARPAYAGTSISARDEAAALLEMRGGNAPGDGSKPYGNVDYADPGYQKDGKKRYPIDTKEHAKAAWSYIHQAKNAAHYTAEQLAKIKAKIKAALKKFGISVDAKDDSLDVDLRGYCPVCGFDAGECERDDADERDDPDGKEYKAIDQAAKLLEKSPPDVKGALSVLHANQAARSEQEPESSTPDDENDDTLRIRISGAKIRQRSRELGFV